MRRLSSHFPLALLLAGGLVACGPLEAGDPVDEADEQVELAPPESDLTVEEVAEAGIPASGPDVNGVRPEPARPNSPAVEAKLAALRLFLDEEGRVVEDELGDAYDPTDATASSEANAAAPVRSDRVRLQGVKQVQDAWCVPASVRTALFSFAATAPTQKRLALSLGTTALGTLMSRSPATLNHFQSKNVYIMTTTTGTAAEVVDRVRFNVNQARAPLIASIQAGELPNWRARGFSGSHGVVLYGWVKEAGQPYRIRTWDPLNVSWSGAHTYRARVIARALRAHYQGLVW